MPVTRQVLATMKKLRFREIRLLATVWQSQALNPSLTGSRTHFSTPTEVLKVEKIG